MPIPPVVDLGPALTAEQVLRHSRQLLLPGLGDEAQRRLCRARVCVVGVTGLAAEVLRHLAAVGVGSLAVVDADLTAATALGRQIAADHPDIEVGHGQLVREDVGNPVAVDAVLTGHDVVVDATGDPDRLSTLSDACVRLGVPEVWGLTHHLDARATVLWAVGPAETRALAASLGGWLDDLLGGRRPAELGASLSALDGQIGAVLATEVIKLVAGVGDPLVGRLLMVDALAARWSEVSLGDGSAADAGALPSPTGARTRRSSSTITATELAALLSGPPAERPYVVDVREVAEHTIVAIPGSHLIPLGRVLDGSALDGLPRDRLIVLHCRSGARSAQALRVVQDAGFSDVAHLEGGILAWVDEVDTTLTRY